LSIHYHPSISKLYQVSSLQNLLIPPSNKSQPLASHQISQPATPKNQPATKPATPNKINQIKINEIKSTKKI
jgi:hypothetical protein